MLEAIRFVARITLPKSCAGTEDESRTLPSKNYWQPAIRGAFVLMMEMSLSHPLVLVHPSPCSRTRHTDHKHQSRVELHADEAADSTS